MWKKFDSKRKTLSESLPGWDLQAVFNPYVLLFTLLSSTFSVLYSSHMNHGLRTTLFTSEISQLDHSLFCMFCWVSTLSFWRTSLEAFFTLSPSYSQSKKLCGWPREMLWGGRWERGSCLGTHVHPWWIHVNVWQNQYSIVK